MIDHLILLAPGGRVVYCGAANQAAEHFAQVGYPCPAHVNPADWFLDVLAGKSKSSSQLENGTSENKHASSVTASHEAAGIELGRMSSDKPMEPESKGLSQ